ncbi:MAG TPA: ATP-dependent protease ATPase subunit HslU [Gemmatimonadales bacterium]|nr:ATP-dependent protease ATPase subunit HslU [Gemmatimonadales bacterium]
MAEPTRTPPAPPAPPASPPPSDNAGTATPAAAEETLPWLEELPPRKIVAELDRYIVGQEVAKKAVAIAVRNRWRRAQAPDDIRDEILPNNIIMIGPTGVGKTEIARRLARLAGAPFLKVEASKFTEVGYVGRDVESMVRELVDVSINMVRTEREDDVYPDAEARAEERLLDLLLPPVPPSPSPAPSAASTQGAGSGEQAAGRPLFVVSSKGDVTPKALEADVEAQERRRRTREKLRQQLKEGKLEEREVEVEVQQQAFPGMEMMQPPQGMEGPDVNFTEWLQEMLPKRKKRRTVHLHEARRILIDEELKKLVDMDDVVNEALDRVENHGVIFIDEIDKIAGERGTVGPDVSREGVQRDLLPIVEGSTVQTRYGYVRTDHVLFIAAGAFHVSKPSDLIPELQGRFPIRVELQPLTEQDFVRIMTEPENALTKQYAALCAADGATLEFTRAGIEEVARIAAKANERMENIGARRLHTVMTTLLEDVLFDLPELPTKHLVFDAAQVRDRLAKIVDDEDLRRYIL